jgi:AraC-like DNA-binding protein/quercetin dioxygenase-like cupin family protein
MKAHYEKIIPLESKSFQAYTYEKPEFDSPWHFHPEYELTFILSSRGVRYVGNQFENFEENDLVLIGPNLPHCWKNTALGQERAAGALVIHWRSDLLGSNWLQKPEFDAINQMLTLSEKGLKFESVLAGRIKDSLIRLVHSNPFDKLILLLQVLNELALTNAYRILCVQGFHDNLKVNDQQRINTIYQYVKSHHHQPITLADISRQVHMSEEAFCRFFSKVMGNPFFLFLNQYRINMACQLLIDSDLAISQVAYACGFESLPFFYRQFSRFKACTPKSYRLAYQKISF